MAKLGVARSCKIRNRNRLLGTESLQVKDVSTLYTTVLHQNTLSLYLQQVSMTYWIAIGLIVLSAGHARRLESPVPNPD